MPSPLRAALVYFGLADDPRVRATTSVGRPAAAVVALCLGTALARTPEPGRSRATKARRATNPSQGAARSSFVHPSQPSQRVRPRKLVEAEAKIVKG